MSSERETPKRWSGIFLLSLALIAGTLGAFKYWPRRIGWEPRAPGVPIFQSNPMQAIQCSSSSPSDTTCQFLFPVSKGNGILVLMETGGSHD